MWNTIQLHCPSYSEQRKSSALFSTLKSPDSTHTVEKSTGSSCTAPGWRAYGRVKGPMVVECLEEVNPAEIQMPDQFHPSSSAQLPALESSTFLLRLG